MVPIFILKSNVINNSQDIKPLFFFKSHFFPKKKKKVVILFLMNNIFIFIFKFSNLLICFFMEFILNFRKNKNQIASIFSH